MKQLLATMVAVAVAGAAPPPPAASEQATPPTPGSKQFFKRTLGPKSWGMAGVGSAVNQANDTPHEWGQGMAGFGKRFASAIGKHVVHKAIQYPLARAFHEEFGYTRSDETRFAPRLKYALLSTVITHKTTTGKKTLYKSEIAGAFGSGLISRTWQPISTRTVSGGFTSGGITLAIDAGMNVTREFWPEIRHPRRSSQLRRTNSGEQSTLGSKPTKTSSETPAAQ